MPLLEIEDVTVTYGDFRAVTSVSMSVDKGEVLALAGANGAGKSTLLRAIAGSHVQSGGAIRFKGESLEGVEDFERVRRGISLVPEGRKLFARLSVKENLLVGAGSRREGSWNIDRVVTLFPMIKPLLNRNASQLSGGQQQAVSIGRALMSNPDLLLLDEVSLGLAPIVTEELYVSLHEVLTHGLAVVVVEQDLSRAFSVATSLVCMLEGHVVLAGPPADLTKEQVTDAYFGHNVTGFGDE